MRVDVPTSTVVIDGHTFPCASYIAPLHEHCQDDPTMAPDYERVIESEDDDVWIPTENGLLVHVEAHAKDSSYAGTYQVSLWWPWCTPTLEYLEIPDSDDAYWTIDTCRYNAQKDWIEPFKRGSGQWIWYGCEEWWVAEFIPRIAHKTVHDEEMRGNPRVKLISLAEGVRLERERIKARAADRN